MGRCVHARSANARFTVCSHDLSYLSCVVALFAFEQSQVPGHLGGFGELLIADVSVVRANIVSTADAVYCLLSLALLQGTLRRKKHLLMYVSMSLYVR